MPPPACTAHDTSMITYMTHAVLTAVTKFDEVTVGSVWVYHKNQWSPIEQVTVTVTQPLTARFATGDTRKIPISRLKTRWENRKAYTAAVERWAGLEETMPLGIGRISAAQAVFDELLPIDAADMAEQVDGALSIRDMDAVCAQTGLRPSELNMFAGAFYELGRVYAPWAAANLLAARLAEQNPVAIERLVRAAKKDAVCAEEHFDDWAQHHRDEARQLRTWYKDPLVTAEQENMMLKVRLSQVEADLLKAVSVARQALNLVGGRRTAAAVDRLTSQLTAITGVAVEH